MGDNGNRPEEQVEEGGEGLSEVKYTGLEMIETLKMSLEQLKQAETSSLYSLQQMPLGYRHPLMTYVHIKPY